MFNWERIVWGENREVMDNLVNAYRRWADENNWYIYARLEGDPGKKGSYRHAGESEREFELHTIVELHSAIPEDCR